MEKFDLSVWLQDKSRKVVTKTGEEVKIIDTNAPDENNPIIGYIYHKQKWNGPWSWHIDGTYKVGGDDMDLFFADEEEKLTEFEKELNRIVIVFSDAHAYMDETEIHHYSKGLIDLARKEILKSLPKWKKATKHEDLEKHIAILEDGKVLLSNYLEENDYYIDLEDLKTLPKEEKSECPCCNIWKEQSPQQDYLVV